ncbi:ankyrin repeat protein [Megavirus baoshan]|uniref:Ankyrin repeat protein n=1 Tax=Megavirus baoshan TaxID=2496520 RepID=A0A3Q8U8Z4_9VIRU|nr:ankyrin repeat protein [Megavirus baoshan]AZL90002.1 ankyrin repeat protein [Megavirus baoshan]
MNKYNHNYKSRINKSEKFIDKNKKNKIKPVVPKKTINETFNHKKHRNSLLFTSRVNFFYIYRDLYTNNNKSEALIKFIQSGVDCYDIDDYFNTHLICACKCSCQDSNIEIVKFLLNQIIVHYDPIFNSVNNLNISRCSALENSLEYALKDALELPGNKQIIELLVKYGVDVNHISCEKTPLIAWASSNYEPDISIAKILLNAGADINFNNYYYKSSLHCILKNGNCKNTYEIIKFLLDNGFDINYEKKMTAEYSYIDHKVYYPEQSIFEYAYSKYKKFNNIRIISLILDYGYDYSVIETRDQKILNIIDTINLRNTYFKSIGKEIVNAKNEFIYRPGSLRYKLVSMNWCINSGYIYNCLTLKNLDVLEYLGIFDERDLISKIGEIIREIYD